jgi:hypothetical protein
MGLKTFDRLWHILVSFVLMVECVKSLSAVKVALCRANLPPSLQCVKLVARLWGWVRHPARWIKTLQYAVELSAALALFHTTCLNCEHLCATSRYFWISDSNSFTGEQCCGCVLQQVGVAVILLIVLMEGSSSLIDDYVWLLKGFWHGFEIKAKCCILHGYYNCSKPV